MVNPPKERKPEATSELFLPDVLPFIDELINFR
uniref:Uncharacterized protein n=1 Tax=Parascaris equorum TaxID=6256 RepID=A0A914RF88_PAREQ